MIIISGCSWSCGEWDVDHQAEEKISILQHGGLGQYIEESGQTVLNLGIPGGSNLAAAKRVQTWLERNPDVVVDKIFMFQTEYDRDHRMIFEDDFTNVTHANTVPNIWVARYCYRLVDIARLARCTVYIIGGVADADWFDNFEQDYPGVKIACQSMTNLLINGDHRVDIPVLSWYNKYSPPLIKRIRSHLDDAETAKLLNDVDRGFERENLVFQHPEWFWPDGNHPNRTAHRVLYDFLVAQGHL
jgi:hypothetical protein